ncbi:MFS transporter [Marinilongibacter aquaticus]|uniref:MFS transporter n=1 Tax=Marinilongibacter aquaticus TaxID=2975157 RepID=UPI0021BDAA9D|nr:MFS transporter [Marinilongibacter aquaticus]UBM58184.1 MFS transporter [Marinilongibacter aquaticus]
MNTLELQMERPLSIPRQQVTFTFLLCIMAYMLCGTIATMMSGFLPVAIPQLVSDQSQVSEISAFVNATFLYGWMAGGLLFGKLSDRFGRKPILLAVTTICGLSTLVTVFVPNWQWLMIYRFFAGAGIGGVILISTVYISEVWPKKTRPIAMGIMAVSFPIGIVSSGMLNLLADSWRNAFWIGLIPLLITGLLTLFMRESPYWEEGNEMGYKPEDKSIFSVNHKSTLIRGAVIYGTVLIGLWGIFSWLPTWIQSLLPEGVAGNDERGMVMMLLGIGGIVGGILSGWLIKIFGERKTLLGTFLGCILACFILFLLNTQFTRIIYLQTAFLSLFLGISQGALSVYIPGLFPASVRGTATGFCFNIGRLFTATAVFFIGSLVTIFGGFGNALFSFSFTFLVAFVALFIQKK